MAGKEGLIWSQSGVLDQSRYGVTGLLGDLELYRAPGLLLHDLSSRRHTVPMDDSWNVVDVSS